jgi:hypothetical protein
MTGTWTEIVSNATCPRCAANGKDSRLTHYATTDGSTSIFQTRCHLCHAVETRALATSIDALKAVRAAHQYGRKVVVGMIAGFALAIITFAAGASVFASMR